MKRGSFYVSSFVWRSLYFSSKAITFVNMNFVSRAVRSALRPSFTSLVSGCLLNLLYRLVHMSVAWLLLLITLSVSI